MHRLDTGHFAVEDCLDEIASNIRRFYLERVAKCPLDENTKIQKTPLRETLVSSVTPENVLYYYS
jgi:hypothetical protein